MQDLEDDGVPDIPAAGKSVTNLMNYQSRKNLLFSLYGLNLFP